MSKQKANEKQTKSKRRTNSGFFVFFSGFFFSGKGANRLRNTKSKRRANKEQAKSKRREPNSNRKANEEQAKGKQRECREYSESEQRIDRQTNEKTKVQKYENNQTVTVIK